MIGWPLGGGSGLLLGGVLALAFAVRAIYALRSAPPLNFVEDDYFFYWTGQQLAQGHGYVSPVATFFHLPSRLTAEHPPLYPLMLAGMSKLGFASVNAQRMFNVAVGTVTVLLVALLARRLAGPRAGLVAGVLCAAYPSFIAANGAIMSETLFGALVAGAMLQAIRCWRRLSLPRAAVLGLLIGLATLTRSEGLLLWPLLVVPIAIRSPRRRGAVIAVAGLGLVLVMTPWVVRNWVDFGRPVLSDDAGVTVAGANCFQTYYGAQLGGVSNACLPAASRGVPAGASEAQLSDHQRAFGVHYAESHATRALVVAAARLAAVWGLYAPGRQVVVIGRRIGVQKAGVGMYYVLLVLGAVGATALWGWRRRDALLVLAAPFVATSIAAVLTAGLVRLRAGAEVSLVVLAALGVERLIRRSSSSPGGPRVGGDRGRLV